MANTAELQQTARGWINTAQALKDKILGAINIVKVSLGGAGLVFNNPMAFLLQLLKDSGVGYEELRQWLTDFLVYVTPMLEISVKTILLTNLKNMVSCSIDPRIPSKYRKDPKSEGGDMGNEFGIDINVESIDYYDKLSVSPLSDEGYGLYFGQEGVTDAYKFARADDFDAFLWFVMHKGKFPSPSKIQDMDDFLDAQDGYGAQSYNDDASLLSTVELSFTSGSPSSILLGNTFTYEGEHVISMCIDRQYDTEDNITHNTLVPVSMDWNSVNWYARRADYLGKNLGFGWFSNGKGGSGRDFGNERGICNIQYIDQASSDAPLKGMVNNKLRFSILPKPIIHIPDIANGEPVWRFVKLTFNDKGEYDPNGKYTLSNPEGPNPDKENGYPTYIVSARTNSVVTSTETAEIQINPKSGAVTVDKPEVVVKNLIECYPGLTVYEFNYDYIMSLKLFDAKVLATSLLNSVLNMDMAIGVSVNKKHQEGREEIKEIVKQIIQSDDSTVSDCYFSFDNSQYDALLQKAEERRARQYKFGNTTHTTGAFDSVQEILSEYDANADLNVQVDVLNRAITQAMVSVTEGVEEKDKYSLEFNLIFNFIENLVQAITEAILSPKVLMLLEVNQQMMGSTWEMFTLKDLMQAMRSIIISIVKEIQDLILQELLKLLLSIIEPLVSLMASSIAMEQVQAYADLIADILRNCPIIWFDFGNRYSEAKLDTVDYADIDTSNASASQAPLNENC